MTRNEQERSYAVVVHQVLREMAEHIAGAGNFRAQLIVMGSILADQKLYKELHTRARQRIALGAAIPEQRKTNTIQEKKT